MSANKFFTDQILSKATQELLDQELNLAHYANWSLEKEIGSGRGNTYFLRRPIQLQATAGRQLTEQNITERLVPVVADQPFHVAYAWTLDEKGFSIPGAIDKYMKPAMRALGAKLEQFAGSLADGLYMAGGTAGSDFDTMAKFLSMDRLADEQLMPMSRKLFINAATRSAISNSDIKSLFMSNEKIDDLVQKSWISSIGNMDIHKSQYIPIHTSGVPGGTPRINGANQAGSTLSIDGMTATTGFYKEGDIITMGIYSVHPDSKVTYATLQQFVVTATTYADGTGAITALPISPDIITSGAYQSVSGSPADNAQISLAANHTKNMMLTKETIALVNMPTPASEAAKYSKKVKYKGVLDVCVTLYYDEQMHRDGIRFDAGWGGNVVRPEYGAIAYGLG